MSLLSELKTALDEHGCTGFTIWITPDGWLQVNLCRKDKVSWDCKDVASVEDIAAHIQSFNEFEHRRGTTKRRVPANREAIRLKQKMLERRRRDDDLA